MQSPQSSSGLLTTFGQDFGDYAKRLPNSTILAQTPAPPHIFERLLLKMLIDPEEWRYDHSALEVAQVR